MADAEIGRRRFTSDLLVNLARRNQSLLYRQLNVINQLEEQEKDPDALADLFRLDHLATRIRRNAESLLVLSGEEPPRTWSKPVLVVDVVRAAIAETEDLDRVAFDIDEHMAVSGKAVADLTHLLAELVENAVHFSPPQARVVIRTRPYLQAPGAQVLSIEDWGVGLRPNDLVSANELLTDPPEVDLSVSQRFGLHVVTRLARRHGIGVSLTPTPGCGVTAVVVPARPSRSSAGACHRPTSLQSCAATTSGPPPTTSTSRRPFAHRDRAHPCALLQIPPRTHPDRDQDACRARDLERPPALTAPGHGRAAHPGALGWQQWRQPGPPCVGRFSLGSCRGSELHSPVTVANMP